MSFGISLDRSGAYASVQAFPIDLFHSLDHFKKPGTSRNFLRFQGRRNSQTYGFLRPAFIRYDEIGGQRIQMAFDAFHAGIEALGVYSKAVSGQLKARACE